MIDDATKQSVNDLLSAAEERFQYGSSRTTMSGLQLEGANLLGKAEAMLVDVLDKDPVAYVELQQRLERIWTAYVKGSDFAGIGACAALLSYGRNR